MIRRHDKRIVPLLSCICVICEICGLPSWPAIVQSQERNDEHAREWFQDATPGVYGCGGGCLEPAEARRDPCRCYGWRGALRPHFWAGGRAFPVGRQAVSNYRRRNPLRKSPTRILARSAAQDQV